MTSDIETAGMSLFEPVPRYLNTAAVGLPTKAALAELDRRIDEWRTGRCDPPSFDADVAGARSAYADIAGTDPASVAMVGAVSTAAGLVAASLPGGSVVLAAQEDFTSVLFPFLADDRLETRLAPLDVLLDRVDDDVSLIAVSAAQSADGRVIDLDRLAEIGAQGVRTYVDTTQAAGWLPIHASRFDVTACHSYKWLCAPRGVGFVTIGEGVAGWLRPINAGWYAGDDPWQSIYGPPVRLAGDARRYDLSPDWFSVAGAARSLEALARLGTDAIGEVSVGLANRFRAHLDIEPSPSAIVSVGSTAGDRLAAEGFVTSSRAGRIRLSFYIYNTVDDVDRAAEIIAGSP